MSKLPFVYDSPQFDIQPLIIVDKITYQQVTNTVIFNFYQAQYLRSLRAFI